MIDRQHEFGQRLAKLLLWLNYQGYKVTLGESFRPAWVALEYAKMGMGIANSLHTDRCAQDLNIFRNDVLLSSVEDLRPVGEFWESLSTPDLPSYWGGRFTTPDTDHFSVSVDNRR